MKYLTILLTVCFVLCACTKDTETAETSNTSISDVDEYLTEEQYNETLYRYSCMLDEKIYFVRYQSSELLVYDPVKNEVTNVCTGIGCDHTGICDYANSFFTYSLCSDGEYLYFLSNVINGNNISIGIFAYDPVEKNCEKILENRYVNGDVSMVFDIEEAMLYYLDPQGNESISQGYSLFSFDTNDKKSVLLRDELSTNVCFSVNDNDYVYSDLQMLYDSNGTRIDRGVYWMRWTGNDLYYLRSENNNSASLVRRKGEEKSEVLISSVASDVILDAGTVTALAGERGSYKLCYGDADAIETDVLSDTLDGAYISLINRVDGKLLLYVVPGENSDMATGYYTISASNPASQPLPVSLHLADIDPMAPQ